MEDKDLARLVLDGVKQGFLTVKWNKKGQFCNSKVKQSLFELIKEGQDKGFLIEVCSGCGSPTSGRDCGCPAGTSLSWKNNH